MQLARGWLALGFAEDGDRPPRFARRAQLHEDEPHSEESKRRDGDSSSATGDSRAVVDALRELSWQDLERLARKGPSATERRQR